MSTYIGQDIGGYRVIEPIGTGGIAKVYKAYDPRFDRFVALKMLPEQFAEDETYLARFTQEAHIIAKLEHRHILPVYDFGEDGGVTYLAMRYLRAGTFKDILAGSPGGRASLGDTVRIIGEVASALDYAHSQDVIHRDVKPSNILIDAQGDAFLTDFGIAKVLEATAHFTKTGGAVGTPAYMSPEQGAGRAVDSRSDVYSLGIVLYQALTGRVPYEADTPLAVRLAHEREPLPPPSDINPDIPEEVERVIFTALAKKPDDRFAMAGAMAQALERAASRVPPTLLGEPDDLLHLSAELAETKSTDEVTHDVRRAARRKPSKPGRRALSPAAIGALVVGLAALAVIVVLLLSNVSAAQQQALDAQATASQQVGGTQEILTQEAQEAQVTATQQARDIQATATAFAGLPTATLDPTQALLFRWLAQHATETVQVSQNATATQERYEFLLTSTVIALTPTATPTNEPISATGGSATVTLVNNSGVTVWFVYISPVTDTSRYTSGDRLGTDTIPSGMSYTFLVPAGDYDLLAEDSGHSTLDTEWGVHLTGGSTYTWNVP